MAIAGREIQPLDSNTASTIGHGQVIVGIFSVVKELLENAIDAGSNLIEIHIVGGGLDRISIVDNGHGIEKENFRLLGCKSCTNKLYNYHDLSDTQTRSLGFRGEAISSLVGLSRGFRIVSKCAHENIGHCIEYNNGTRSGEAQPVSRTPGTTVTVESLFYNMPVRRAAVKHIYSKEIVKVVHLLHLVSLSHPEIGVTLYEMKSGSKRCLFSVTRSSKRCVRDVVECLFNSAIVKVFVDLDMKFKVHDVDVVIKGWINNPNKCCDNAGSGEYYFVNNRYAEIVSFSKFFKRFYKTFKRHYFVILFIEMENKSIDFNLCPDKMSVKIRHEDSILDEFSTRLRKLFCDADVPKPSQIETKKENNVLNRESIDQNPIKIHPNLADKGSHKSDRTITSDNVEIRKDNGLKGQPGQEQHLKVTNMDKPDHEKVGFVLDKKDFSRMEVVGQFNDGFIITKLPNSDGEGCNLFILDQHASDERYRYEMLKREVDNSSQMMIRPLQMHLSPSEEILLSSFLNHFSKIGCEFFIDNEKEPGNRVFLKTRPFYLNTSVTQQDVQEMLSFMTDDLNSDVLGFSSKIDRYFATKACRSSVMIGTKLHQAKMLEIVQNMLTTNNPWCCPHGRPTIRHLLSINPPEEQEKPLTNFSQNDN